MADDQIVSAADDTSSDTSVAPPKKQRTPRR